MHKDHLKAVVSGGASGLGFAVARHIVAQGGQVALLDINAEQGAAAVQELGERARFYQTDISDAGQVDAACDAAALGFGGLNLAVGCAGVLGAGRILGKNGPMAAEFFQKVININLVGSFLLTRAAARHMAENAADERGERGLIVHTASIAAYEGQFGQAAYSASKAGIVGMILPMAREFAKLGIRINAIAPGMFETAMMSSVTEEIRQQLYASVPFPSRFGSADEFAAMVQHMVDNQMLNGTVVRLDGAARLQ
ncbi:MAG: SDR family NAD(P)-dependent oxidoreductase [Gammaproteobacteria bacterium]|nr:SDR family NAD(P)-dependent oxidoreductase [Gammaproteobacteria bacterium]